jgi:hypothetical protein
MIKLRNMIVAMIAIFALTTSAYAGSFSVGLTASNMDMKASGTETDRLTAAGANIADTSIRKKSITESATVGSIFVEYTTDFRFPIAFGVEYTPGEIEISKKLSRTDSELSQTGQVLTTAFSNKRTASAEATNFATAYVEIPLFKGLYVRGGLANMSVNHENDSNLGGSTHLTGTNFGAGFKHTTAGGMILKASYEETDYDTISLRSDKNSVAANSTGVKADVDTEAYRFSIAKNF